MSLVFAFDEDALLTRATEITRKAMHALDGSHDFEHACKF
jgi:hypothetical protein